MVEKCNFPFKERERERETCKNGLNQDSRLLDILLSHWPLKNGMPKQIGERSEFLEVPTVLL